MTTPRKTCTRCGRRREVKHFYVQRGKPRAECKTCTLAARIGKELSRGA